MSGNLLKAARSLLYDAPLRSDIHWLVFWNVEIFAKYKNYSILLLSKIKLFNIKIHAKYLYKNSQAFALTSKMTINLYIHRLVATYVMT